MCENLNFNIGTAEIDYTGLEEKLGARANELLSRIVGSLSTKPLIELTGPAHIGAHYATELLNKHPGTSIQLDRPHMYDDDSGNSDLETLAQV
jgi:hypothetical protein